jgi:hypothetical protein
MLRTLADLREYVEQQLPDSAERAVGLRKLEEARMWLSAALRLRGQACH